MLFRNKKDTTEIEYYYGNLYNGLVYKIDNDYYILKNNRLIRFISYRAFKTWRMPDAQNITLRHEQPEFGGVVGFRDGTIIVNAADGKLYLISDSKRRLITAPLGDYGWTWDRVLEVSEKETNAHEQGEPI